jgi:hypothetical protein
MPTISPISQSRSVTFAAIARVVRGIFWMRTKLQYIANSATEWAWFSTFLEFLLAFLTTGTSYVVDGAILLATQLCRESYFLNFRPRSLPRTARIFTSALESL